MDPKLKMDVPPQVREFAQKSVDQAERAISSFMDSASKSVAVVPGPMTNAAKHAFAITEKNLKASFEHARKLMRSFMIALTTGHAAHGLPRPSDDLRCYRRSPRSPTPTQAVRF